MFDIESVNLVEFASRFTELKRVGKEHKGRCPSPHHADENPSFHIYEKNGQQKFKCFGCGIQGGVIDLYADIYGLDAKADFTKICGILGNGHDLPPVSGAAREPLKKAPPRTTTKPPKDCLPPPFATKEGMPDPIYPYLDADGDLLGYAAQYPGKLQYWTWGTRSPNDTPKWEKRAFSHPTPLYGLEQLARKRAARVIICHDERAAEAATLLFTGNPCIAWGGGDHAYQNTDWTPILDRADPPLLIPRNDPAGWQIMARLAVHLYSLGIDEVKRINTDTYEDGGALIETPQGWSLADAEGWTTASALAWAKARMETYPRPEGTPPLDADPIPHGDSPPSANIPHREIAQDAPEPPESDPILLNAYFPDCDAPAQPTPADSSPAKPAAVKPTPLPRKQRKPRLSIVGNTVQEIDPEADLPPAFSEDALAEAFTSGPGVDWRYTAAWGVWHQWDGQRWSEDVTKRVTWDARNVCRDKANEGDLTQAGRQKIATLKTVNAVLGLAGSDPRHATAPQQWDADLWLLGTPGGVVDLKTGKLTEADPAQLISKQTAIAPLRGPHPWWDKVLERATKGDDSLRTFIQRWCGYLLTGDTREERFLFVHGPGGGGKSKFLSPLAEIMGDYRRTAKMESFTAKDRSEHSEEIARLAGARMVTASETEDGARWNEARIKQLTGRDTIAARHMHKSTFQFQPQFKLIFIGNHKPALRSVGEEMRRRIDLIEWGGTIPEEDRILDLPDRLKAEYPAILQWMIDGCIAWQDCGLGKPERISEAVDDYLQGEDTLGAWMDDCIEQKPDATTKLNDAYLSFKRWAESAGEYVLSQKRFSQKLVDRGFTRKKISVSVFVGFTLKTAEPQRQGYGSRED